MSYTDDSFDNFNNYKMLLVVVMFLQVGGCGYVGGDEFFIMPFLCTASALTGGAEILQMGYIIALALNPVVIVAGLAFKKLTPIALAFGAFTFVGILLQIFLLSNGVFHCEGP